MTSVAAHFVLPNGTDLSSGTITFTPTELRRAGTDDILTPEPIEVTVSSDGVADSPDLVPGGYTVRVESGWFTEVYTIVVPDSDESVDLMDLIEQFAEVPDPLVSKAWAAATSAESSAGRAEDAANRAETRVDDAIADGAEAVRQEVKADADRAFESAGAAEQSAIQAAQTLANKADLDGDGKIPQSQIPAVAVTDHLGAVASQSAMLSLTGQRGDWCIRTDTGTMWVLAADNASQITSWVEWVYPTSPVQTVAGRTGAVTLSVDDVSGAASEGYVNTQVAGRVPTTSTGSRLYGTNSSGQNSPIEFSSQPRQGTIPYRATGGVITVGDPDPDNPEHATNVKFVKERIQLVDSLPASPEDDVLYLIPKG
ncbi:hypothetical protein [Rhodococcus spongiicola]|uniref:Phage tail protein n=1 Tax=Rhodococcus spongiicola TaxID=2487352 RepID=A0A3S3B9G3_9NOCA|nr:hypothetical protein [Rhodococcus spongiicola]RVW06214.1 hypothetical protein EF834_01800 [Rhodococcus spongiicola]